MGGTLEVPHPSGYVGKETVGGMRLRQKLMFYKIWQGM